MSTRSKLAVAGAAGLLLTALPVLAKTLPKTKPKVALVKTAIIENIGSTNTFGYRIMVSVTKTGFLVNSSWNNGHDNNGDYGASRQMQSRTLHLFSDLDAAMPLPSLPVHSGVRSASFGTQTFITYKGQKSPDLTFASDPRSAALKADIGDFVQALGVKVLPRHPAPLTTIPFIPDASSTRP